MIDHVRDLYFPMTYVRDGFRDIVDGRQVSYYITSGTGKHVLAVSRWSWFRVEVRHDS
jgi:cold shock CspA family protein